MKFDEMHPDLHFPARARWELLCETLRRSSERTGRMHEPLLREPDHVAYDGTRSPIFHYRGGSDYSYDFRGRHGIGAYEYRRDGWVVIYRDADGSTVSVTRLDPIAAAGLFAARRRDPPADVERN